MERVLKMCCTDCPCFDLLAASIRKSGLEIENQCKDCPCLDLFAASIRKSGPEIRNRCTEVPGMNLVAAAIAKSGPEIGNHSSAIVSASRMARLRRRCRNGAASDSNFLCRKVLQFRLQQSLRQRRIARLLKPVVAVLNGPPAAVVAATMPRPILIFVVSKKNSSPAAVYVATVRVRF